MMDYLLGGIISINITRARNSSCIKAKRIISQNLSTSLPESVSYPLIEAMSILSTRSSDEFQLNEAVIVSTQRSVELSANKGDEIFVTEKMSHPLIKAM